LPKSDEHGRTGIPGVYVVGDLSGIPLLKLSLDSGVRAVRDAKDRLNPDGSVDVCIIGGGVSGVAAAIEASKLGLSYQLLESNRLFSTIANFPKGKPIYTYPTELTPEGELQVSAEVKEGLLDELCEQAKDHAIEATPQRATHIKRSGKTITVHVDDADPITARAVIIAIGRSGNYRTMGIPGEESDKVANRLHDPAAFHDQRVLVVGGGDSACETAIAIADGNTGDEALVTLAYRSSELTRPKPGNRDRVIELAEAGKIDLRLSTEPRRIDADSVTLSRKGGEDETIPNEAVFAMIGREPPLGFFRRSGLAIHGERSIRTLIALSLFLVAATVIYGMKGWLWPFSQLNATALNPGAWIKPLAARFADQTTLIGTLLASATSPSFWVTLAYSSAVVGFGIDRLRRRKTPYVWVQTLTLMTIQCVPLFILPEIMLPWAGANGWIPQTIVDNLFPGESWWRAYGFVLAWPLMAWNVFTQDPIVWWLVISFVQTFIIIPLIVWRWGKGAYCGWICSCGALAETMGDRHREKMPHGPGWNALNMVGQVVLWTAGLILLLHAVMWLATEPGERWGWVSTVLMKGYWKYAIDWLLAGALGVGLYFWLSGRVWCRFACPLAALMHIFARFSRFRIAVEGKKCISCNACTSVCHQGIDVMGFASRNAHMEDPECVRCSACVATCPTGVLQFGRVDAQGDVIALDKLAASPVVMRESGGSNSVAD
jgi:NosR/NirI family nitrous oxide reductase transcriptional regulator